MILTILNTVFPDRQLPTTVNMFASLAPEAAALQEEEAPFAVANGGLYVRIKISGSPYWFYLDSDSYTSTIDPVVVKRLKGVKEISVPQNDPAVGGVAVDLDDVEIGGARLNHQRFFESTGLTRALSIPFPPKEFGGLLGYNVLRLLCIGIDFDTRQFWAWGPGKGEIARKELFGVGRSTLVTHISPGPQMTSDCEWNLGGEAGTAEIDTGSFWGAVTAEQASKLSSHFKLGPQLSVSTPGGLETGKLGFVDQLKMGSLTYIGPYLEVEPGSSGSVVGWNLLQPLGRVVLDFDGGRLDRISGLNRFSPLALAVASSGIRQVDDKTLIYGRKTIPIDSAVSANGNPISLSDWTVNTSDYRSSVMKWLGSGDDRKGRAVFTYRLKGNLTEIPLGGLPVSMSVLKEPHLLAKPSEFLDEPGYYLPERERAIRLPFGPALVSGKQQIISVGGLPQPIFLGKYGRYEKLLLPRPDQYDVLKVLFGWQEVIAPLWISRDGAAHHLSTGEKQLTCTLPTFLSPGSWKWRVGKEGESVILSKPM